MMYVTPKINGLIPTNTVELIVPSGKILGLSNEYEVDLNLTLSGQVPAMVVLKLEVVNKDFYRFEDGTSVIMQKYTMNSLSQNERPAFQIRNITHFVKTYPRLVLIVYSWEEQTGDGMADADGADFPVVVQGKTIKFTRFK